jgi:hypothetical protein
MLVPHLARISNLSSPLLFLQARQTLTNFFDLFGSQDQLRIGHTSAVVAACISGCNETSRTCAAAADEGTRHSSKLSRFPAACCHSLVVLADVRPLLVAVGHRRVADLLRGEALLRLQRDLQVVGRQRSIRQCSQMPKLAATRHEEGQRWQQRLCEL